jgi:hypothetical protein
VRSKPSIISGVIHESIFVASQYSVEDEITGGLEAHPLAGSSPTDAARYRSRATACTGIRIDRGRVAQLGERVVRNDEAEGSNPFLSTIGSSREFAGCIPRILPRPYFGHVAYKGAGPLRESPGLKMPGDAGSTPARPKRILREDAVDFYKFWDGIPEGTWVAISNDQERVAGKGLTIEEALEEAKRNGELDPCITRVFRGMIL